MALIEVEKLDHFVLTVAHISATCKFYRQALGMEVHTFGENRTALKFGEQKINLHQAGNEFEPKAARPTPGSADLCLITRTSLDQVVQHLNTMEIVIVEGPVHRTAANGTIQSVCFRDPDGNLIEVSNYS